MSAPPDTPVALEAPVFLAQTDVPASGQVGEESSWWGALSWTRSQSILLALAIALGLAIYAARWHRLKHALRRPVVFQPQVGLMLLFGMFVLGVIGANVATRVFGIDAGAGDFQSKTKFLLCVYAAQAIVVVWYVSLLKDRRRSYHNQRLDSGHAVFLGILALMVIWPIVMSVGNVAGLLSELLLKHPPQVVGHDTLKLFVSAEHDVWFWYMAALVTVFPGVMEEVMYRGLLQEVLGRLFIKRWAVIGMTSMVFVLAHVGVATPEALASLFVLSLGFGWAYEKTGRLIAPIMMHIAFNAVNLTMAVLLV